MGEWFTKIFFHFTLSSHTDPRKPFIFKGLRASTPQETSIHFTLSSGNGVESPPLLLLASPTLPYRELTLHLLYTFSLYKICKPTLFPKNGSARPTSSRQILGDTYCRKFVSFVSQKKSEQEFTNLHTTRTRTEFRHFLL